LLLPEEATIQPDAHVCSSAYHRVVWHCPALVEVRRLGMSAEITATKKDVSATTSNYKSALA
jgi:hypothetical protein